MARILGFTFAIKIMGNGENASQEEYAQLAGEVEESILIRQQEGHENALLGMLDEERFQYVGSMVLGLNVALVELTGSLAGFTYYTSVAQDQPFKSRFLEMATISISVVSLL